MKLGVDVLLESQLHLVRGKRVGLITNPTGVDRNLVSIIERLRAVPELNVVALYGPEHGVRGNAQAGEFVDFSQEEAAFAGAFVEDAIRFEDIDQYEEEVRRHEQ